VTGLAPEPEPATSAANAPPDRIASHPAPHHLTRGSTMERHDLDVLSLFSGLLFVAVAVVGLTDLVTLSLADLRWLGPLAVVAFGVVLVVTSTGGRGGGDGPDHDVDTAADAGSDRETQPIAQDG